MGIGFDVFKANIGWNLADSAMNAISNSIEKNAREQEAREQAAKKLSDRTDMLKTLVFMVANNIALDRSGKKSIAKVLSTIYDENISLFSIEEQIDSLYSQLKNQNLKQFFSNIAAINTDREQVCAMYLVAMLLYMGLSEEQAALPAHAYNLALTKKFFGINRSELAQCYALLGEKLGKETDDIADVFEELTSEESIKQIEAENPTLVYDATNKSMQSVAQCQNPKEEIEKCYTSTVQGSDKSFSDRFFLADTNPKKVLAAVNHYAKNCKGEEIIACYDDSSFCNAKAGFLLSNKKLYICNSFEKPQEIELSSVQVITAVPKLVNSCIKVDDVEISTSMLNGAGTELLSDFLQKTIPLAIQIQVSQ